VISVRDQNICRAREPRSIDADQNLASEISAQATDEEQVATLGDKSPKCLIDRPLAVQFGQFRALQQVP
jgi:hypothetical protein